MIAPMPATATPAPAPRLIWQRQGDRAVLRVEGDWRGAGVPERPSGAPATGDAAAVQVDATALQGWDRALTTALWVELAPLRTQGARFELDGLPDGVRAPLELALPADGDAAAAAPTLPTRERDWAHRFAADALTTLAFVGEVLLAFGRLLRGRSRMRGSDLLRQLDLCGPLSLGIVGLTSSLVGLMLAYMGGAQLDRIGAQGFIADVVTIGVVREMAAMMTGIILAGRVGAAFAAQLGTMQSNEEIDALRTLGIDPIDYLVMPRLLAMLLIAPLLVSYAAVLGVAAGALPTTGIYGVAPSEYWNRCLAALNWTHLWVGLFKGTMYAALVALAGCLEGLHAGRSAQAVGEATTTAVVKALVWIVVAASASTALFQSLGL
jgi:phospholipid/cholesterol/gamma-HCH transport system permease protein